MQKLGLILIVLSFLPWVAIPFVLPFLPLSAAQKALAIPVLLVLAEIFFWLGLLLVGKEVAQRYRQYFTLGFLKKQVRKFRRRR
ncbi:MAG: transporter suffix domain-containing protein [Tolypothrix carrinoi HA7290-LM1]|jgi:hypothetical protein|nr:transporter suffix domain-containing protein [Tolypothrix carrinoi HA7290-LM1]